MSFVDQKAIYFLVGTSEIVYIKPPVVSVKREGFFIDIQTAKDFKTISCDGEEEAKEAMTNLLNILNGHPISDNKDSTIQPPPATKKRKVAFENGVHYPGPAWNDNVPNNGFGLSGNSKFHVDGINTMKPSNLVEIYPKEKEEEDAEFDAPDTTFRGINPPKKQTRSKTQNLSEDSRKKVQKRLFAKLIDDAKQEATRKYEKSLEDIKTRHNIQP